MKDIKEKDLQKLLETFSICSIPKNRNYWLFRINNGKNFNDFYMENFIAIGHEESSLYDELCLDLIKSEDYELIHEEVKRIDTQYYEYCGIITYYMDVFINRMKKGDIILCPSENSSYIAFGILEDDKVTEISEEKSRRLYNSGRCHFRKRRKVKWYKYVERDNLDLYLHKLLNSYYAVAEANDYSHYINRSLYNFFISNNKLYVIFEVKNNNNINAVEILNFINNVIYCIEIYNKLYDKSFNKEDIDMKINVHSPGPIEFSSYISMGLVIAVAIIALAGGKGKFKKSSNEIEGELETDGLIIRILEFYKAIKENKLSEKEMEWKEDFINTTQQLNIKIPNIDEEDKK
ncbi:hypothetical protein [Natronospora cellulosivora (SeqCode)]